MKQFKAESKRLLDLMINSIYTNREIFLRELISNASDAMDKLYYRSLTEKNININKEDLKIRLDIDKEKRTLSISDRGCGMTEEELEKNLGTIAKSGSLAFKEENDKKEDIDIIGQFGVGFYSAFMVSKSVTVISKAYGESQAHIWKSEGASGYTIEPCEKEEFGTKIILEIKDDTEDEKYSEYLEAYKIQEIVKKYSDYIRYPIVMEIEHSHKKEGTENEYETVKELETLNSMVPIWKKKKTEVKEEDYNNFYSEKFYDFEKPLKVIHNNVEGGITYNSLLYIPSHLPYDYYTKEYEKGLALYSNGVLIMEKCADLLPDYFSFVKGLVDSQDLSLNISREMLQHDRGLKVIARSIEKKIISELEKMLKEQPDEYEKFFKIFGVQLKFGTYNNYGMDKDKLKDLLLFYSSTAKKLITLEQYVSKMIEGQDSIYYACGESIDKIDLLPQVELIKDKGYEILYLTDQVDEFVFQVLMNYKDKKFVNVSAENVDLDTEEEKEKLKKENEKNKDMFDIMKEALSGEVQNVRFTHRLKNHPVCLTSEGNISVEMEKVLNSMPNDQKVKAQTVLEINENHEIAKKIKELYSENKEELKNYTKILYSLARLIEGLSIENPTEISNLICKIMS
ncbi:MAG: molecular chaperone HtpG [Candidatus Scatovivens sp.]